MYSDEDLKGLHAFLRQTAEGNLMKILAGGKMTEAHVKCLIRVARAVNADDWAMHWQAGTFPKVKFNPAEVAMKESFYTIWGDASQKIGLITPAKKVA